MPVSSYLGFPRTGFDADRLVASLLSLPHCEAERSQLGECIIVVTDTPDVGTENALRERLESHPGLAGLSLVFAAEAASPADAPAPSTTPLEEATS